MTLSRTKMQLSPKLLWLVLAPTSSWAITTAPVTIDFSTFTNGAYYGKSNTSTGCTITQPCYDQFGIIVGTPNGNGFDTHIHQKVIGPILDANGNETGYDDYGVSNHNDAAGIYIRANDGSSFSADSFRMIAPIAADNKRLNFKGQEAFFEIIGFSESIVPDASTFAWGTSSLAAGVSTPPATHPKQVAYQSVANGFTGTLVLNDNFKNVKAIWIHYGNYPQYPISGDRSTWNLVVDDVKLSKPVIPGCP